MSDAAITNDCLHHYDNRHIQVRWDFFDLCAYDKSQFNCRLNGNGKIIKDEPNQECMAKILRVLETLTDAEKLRWHLDAKKLKEQGLTPPPEPKEYPIQLSYGAIVTLLYGTYGESTVRNSVAVLIQREFIKQYQETKNSIPFYVLGTDIVQKALKDQAERALSGVEINSQAGGTFQVLKSTARRPKSTAKPLKSKGRPGEINSQAFEINNNNNNKKKTKNENKQKENNIPPSEPVTSSFVANATIPFVSSSDDDDLEQKTSHIVIEATNKSAEPKTTRNHQSLEQNPLFDATPKSPVMPPESAKWCAETVVQIVEFRRNKRFLEDARGKSQKSQRERQLDAAKKIIDAKITREEFIKAYDARNDAWWQDNRGDLTVVDMAAKTTKGVMRTLEVLENIDSKKGVKTQSNGRQAQPSQCNSILTQEEKDFRKWLVSQPKEERPKILKARREARLAAQAQA